MRYSYLKNWTGTYLNKKPFLRLFKFIRRNFPRNWKYGIPQCYLVKVVIHILLGLRCGLLSSFFIVLDLNYILGLNLILLLKILSPRKTKSVPVHKTRGKIIYLIWERVHTRKVIENFINLLFLLWNFLIYWETFRPPRLRKKFNNLYPFNFLGYLCL